MLLNCGVGEDSWESLGLQGDPTSPFWRRSTWDFFGRNDAKAETPVPWPPHVKSWLIGKDSDAGRDWGQEEKGTTEDEMAGWHHGLDGCECEWTPGAGNGQGSLACCNSWDRKESDTTEWLNWTELNWKYTTWWHDVSIHGEMTATVKRTKLAITSQSYCSACVCWGVGGRMLQIYSLFKLQVSNTSLLNVGTVWYLRSPELVHLITERVHPLTITSAFPPAPNACQPSFYYQSISIFFCNFLDQSGFSLGKV